MDDVASKSIDVAFDKGTLDAMVDGQGSLLSPSDEMKYMTSRYMREVRHQSSKTSEVTLIQSVHRFAILDD
jgi:hypothetical protein